jgi:tight adherence protein C
MTFDFNLIVILVPVVVVLYQGVDLFMENRRAAHSPWGAPRASAAAKPTEQLADRAAQFGPNKLLLKMKTFREGMELLLMRSGNPFGWSVEKLLLYRELTTIAVVVTLWEAEWRDPLSLVVGAFVGFKVLDFYLTIKASARLQSIQRALPGYVDLLALTLESGLDLLAATERIIEKMKANALRDELQILIQESKLGTARKEALLHLAHRTNLPDIQSLTSIIIQSEELGTSLAMVLRSYAEDMRSKRILRAEEVAGKAPVKLLFPMMVFFFPIVFIVIFGPLALNFLKSSR